MLSSLLVLVLAVVAPTVHATVFVTNPTAASVVTGGQPSTITWQDDNNVPSLKQFGACSIGLYAGNQLQQTLLQPIATNLDVSVNSSVTWTPQSSVGPNFNAYFIRFTSNSLPDASQANAFAEAFSAKFAMTGMTGTFNATVSAEISGIVSSTAGSSTPVTSGSSAGSTVTTSKPSLSASTVKSSSSPSSTSTKAASNGAGRIVVPSVVGASGVAAIAFAFFL